MCAQYSREFSESGDPCLVFQVFKLLPIIRRRRIYRLQQVGMIAYRLVACVEIFSLELSKTDSNAASC